MMTVTRRDGGLHQSPFGRWIQGCQQLESTEFNISVQDNDMWIHRFSERNERLRNTIHKAVEHIQLIEIKSFAADQSFAQKDTFDCIDQMLRKASVLNNRRRPIKITDNRFGNHGRIRNVRWLGIHLLKLSSDRPDTSDKIMWDNYHVSIHQLIELLRFDRDPDHPTRFLDTRRHHLQPAYEQVLPFERLTGKK